MAIPLNELRKKIAPQVQLAAEAKAAAILKKIETESLTSTQTRSPREPVEPPMI